MKQTAVEQLESKILYIIPSALKEDVIILFKQAKAMEKEQIVEAHLEGQFQADGLKANRVAEQYYNETFKSE